MAAAPLVAVGQKQIQAPLSAFAERDRQVHAVNNAQFTLQIGDPIPFLAPNVRSGHEPEDLSTIINGPGHTTSAAATCVCATFCCLTGIGCCYLWCKQQLVEKGEYGFSMDNGVPRILMPGRHMLASPLNIFEKKVSEGDDRIEAGPISIVRVPQGKFGMAMNNSSPEILLPGLHCRNNAAFKYQGAMAMDQELIDFGPIKFLTVKSGMVRVCYNTGKVQIFKEGRYGVNSGTFAVAGTINTQQQNLRFEKHPVLLDGGISMLVEGLLTYQVTDVERLIHQLGDRDLVRAIQDVTKAELSRVFASIHLEEISSSASANDERSGGHDNYAEFDDGKHGASQPLLAKQGGPVSNPAGLMGVGPAAAQAALPSTHEGETRSRICSAVVEYIKPITASWGVHIINFQLESTKIADDRYAAEYEAASLAMAKAKANLRAVDAENKIRLQKSRAAAMAVKIEAEGAKTARVIQATGEADARKIEANSRNSAAKAMNHPFAQAYAMAGQQVEFARALKAKVLTVVPESAVGKTIAQQSMLGGGEHVAAV